MPGMEGPWKGWNPEDDKASFMSCIFRTMFSPVVAPPILIPHLLIALRFAAFIKLFRCICVTSDNVLYVCSNPAGLLDIVRVGSVGGEKVLYLFEYYNNFYGNQEIFICDMIVIYDF